MLLLGCSESNFVFSYENERRFSIRRISNDHERSNSINLISQRSHELLFASINAFIVSSSASTDLPERGASSTSKLPDRNFANQFWHWRSVDTCLLHTHRIIFFLLEQHFYLFGSKKVKYAENAAFHI